MLGPHTAIRRMATLIFLIQVSRPIVWPVLPLVYYLGLHAAHASLTPAAIVQMAMLTFPMNLIGCGLNDSFDYESDRLCARRRAIWGAVVTAADRPLIIRWSIAMALLVLFGAILTQNTNNILATTGILLMAVSYSVPPIRLKERPPLDSLANGAGYFLFPFAMGYSLDANPWTMPGKYFLLALTVCGIHALATAADYDADKAAGHRTLAVVYGRRTAAIFAFATFLTTWLLADFQGSAVRLFIAVGTLATLMAALFPHELVIMASCVIIFCGFLIAGMFHIAG